MYAILSGRSLREVLRREGAPALVALVTTELAFKLGSFTLECGVFLAIWYVAGFVAAVLRGERRAGEKERHVG